MRFPHAIGRRGRPLRRGHGVKTRYPLFAVPLAAFALSLAIAAVTATAAETPFKGTVNGVETGEIVFPNRLLDRHGTGTATYLGKYTEHVTMQIFIPTLSSTGAANLHRSKRRHHDGHGRRAGDPDEPHHALDRRALHHHRRNGTLRRCNRQLRSGKHTRADNGG